MDDRPLLTVAHRAGNNVADLRTALDAGVDLVEADIHLFRGALEVRHCKALGGKVFWEPGYELFLRRNACTPQLAEVLAAAQGDWRLMLDLKGPSLKVADHVAALLREVAPELPITVCTKQWRMFEAFAANTHVRQVFSASTTWQLSRLRARLRRQRAYGVSIRRQLLTRSIVAELRESTDVVLVWPVDTVTALEHARWLGVTGVISKNLPMLRGLIASGPPAPAPFAAPGLITPGLIAMDEELLAEGSPA